MPRRLFLALLLLVAAPMVLLGWLSASATKASQIAAKESLANLLSSQLSDADLRISQLFDGYAARLDEQFESGESTFETLRALRREFPVVRQGLFVDEGGRVLYPTAGDSVGIDAAEVAASIPGMIDARPMPNQELISARSSKASKGSLQQKKAAAKAESLGSRTIAVKGATRKFSANDAASAKRPEIKGAGKLASGNSSAQIPNARPTFGESAWQQWYMADGAQVVYWKFRSDGASVGILLERSRWMADLIAVLPDDVIGSGIEPASRFTKNFSKSKSSTIQATPIGSVALVDEAQRTIYRWGRAETFTLPELAASNLSEPLASWQLRLHVDETLIPKADFTATYLSLAGVALVLLAIGFYVLTAVQRQINEAKSRVSFAGQVSHELRTPLTNIRLYTELAESDLEKIAESDVATSLSKRLEVIDHESRRLQRLVSGVLEMIRPTGKPVGVRPRETDLCELVQGIADQFAPSFAAAELTLETSCEIEQLLLVDPDVVEMILVNLLSNVEKYVPRGGRCRVECRLSDASDSRPRQLQIVVSDDGPGIGPMHRARVFRPFQRIDDSISAPSGTGIGLTIARRAARRHGGDLVLMAKSALAGADFELTIPIPETTD